MPTYYTYLISTLPSLQFGMKPPFSYAAFMAKCEGFISEEDFSLVKELPNLEIDKIKQVSNLAIKNWLMFDAGIRNELVRARAARLHREPAKYLRAYGLSDALITHIAASAYRNPNLLEAEKALDQARWKRLEELSTGHYFDSDIVFVYALKLLILERWEKIKQQDASALLAEVIRRD